jgi:hypothetical protein
VEYTVERSALIQDAPLEPSAVEMLQAQINQIRQQAVGTFQTDDVSQIINHTLVNNLDISFIAAGIASANIVIPNTVSHGFIAGINIVSGAIAPTFNLINQSDFPIIIAYRGRVLERYEPKPNTTIVTAFWCDGINVYVEIAER